MNFIEKIIATRILKRFGITLKEGKMKVINWQTTLGAILVVAGQYLSSIGIDLSSEVQNAITTLGIFIIGLFAKDSNVTGGTKPNRKVIKK